jgi:hypothetical protein
MISMYIGSGDVSALMSGIDTVSYNNLLNRFVSGEIPYYNSKASPIDALRTGAILEDRYQLILPENYYPQFKSTSKEMDVLKCSLDFAKMEDGKIVDFDELKTCSFTDFLNFEPFRANPETGIDFIKKAYKKNYEQIQEQLYCTELESANLVYLAVYSYNDEENYIRDIQPNEYIKFRIFRDEKTIEAIKERAKIFQTIKDYYTKKDLL